jgi:hypothetical protein
LDVTLFGSKTCVGKIRNPSLNILWSGDKEKRGIALVEWKKVVLPKEKGGWGIKYLSLFAKVISTNYVWRPINEDGLWIQVMGNKYIELESMEYWIRISSKSHHNASILWKVVV